MARANLIDLIDIVRDLTGADQSEFTDSQIETALDATRIDRFYEWLKPEPTPTNVDPDVFYSDVDYWDAGYSLTDSSYVALAEATSGDVSEPLRGRFVLAATTTGSCLITGRTYDPYAAAATILEQWASKVALDFDFSADGQSFSRSQKQKALLAMAATMRSRSKPRRARLVRPDEAG